MSHNTSEVYNEAGNAPLYDMSFNHSNFKDYICKDVELNEARKFIHEKISKNLNSNCSKKTGEVSRFHNQYSKSLKNCDQRNTKRVAYTTNNLDDVAKANKGGSNKSSIMNNSINKCFKNSHVNACNNMYSEGPKFCSFDNVMNAPNDYKRYSDKHMNGNLVNANEANGLMDPFVFEKNHFGKQEMFPDVNGNMNGNKKVIYDRYINGNKNLLISDSNKNKPNRNMDKNCLTKHNFDNRRGMNGYEQSVNGSLNNYNNNCNVTNNSELKNSYNNWNEKRNENMADCATMLLNEFNMSSCSYGMNNQNKAGDLNANGLINPNMSGMNNYNKGRNGKNDYSIHKMNGNATFHSDQTNNKMNNANSSGASSFELNNNNVHKNRNMNLYNESHKKDFNEKQQNNGDIKNNRNGGSNHPEKEEENIIKLFFGNLAPITTEKDMYNVFTPYGRCSSLIILKDRRSKSRGSGFVTFYDQNEAINAIKCLNNKITLPGAHKPLEVRFPEDKSERQLRTKLLSVAKCKGEKIPPSGCLLIDTEDVLIKKTNSGHLLNNWNNNFNESRTNVHAKNDSSLCDTTSINTIVTNGINNGITSAVNNGMTNGIKKVGSNNNINNNINNMMNNMSNNCNNINMHNDGSRNSDLSKVNFFNGADYLFEHNKPISDTTMESLNTNCYKMGADELMKSYSESSQNIERENTDDKNIVLSNEECGILLPKFLIDTISCKKNSADSVGDTTKYDTSSPENKFRRSVFSSNELNPTNITMEMKSDDLFLREDANSNTCSSSVNGNNNANNCNKMNVNLCSNNSINNNNNNNNMNNTNDNNSINNSSNNSNSNNSNNNNSNNNTNTNNPTNSNSNNNNANNLTTTASNNNNANNLTNNNISANITTNNTNNSTTSNNNNSDLLPVVRNKNNYDVNDSSFFSYFSMNMKDEKMNEIFKFLNSTLDAKNNGNDCNDACQYDLFSANDNNDFNMKCPLKIDLNDVDQLCGKGDNTYGNNFKNDRYGIFNAHDLGFNLSHLFSKNGDCVTNLNTGSMESGITNNMNGVHVNKDNNINGINNHCLNDNAFNEDISSNNLVYTNEQDVEKRRKRDNKKGDFPMEMQLSQKDNPYTVLNATEKINGDLHTSSDDYDMNIDNNNAIDDMLKNIINLYTKNKSSIFTSHMCKYLSSVLCEINNSLEVFDECNAKNSIKGINNSGEVMNGRPFS